MYSTVITSKCIQSHNHHHKQYMVLPLPQIFLYQVIVNPPPQLWPWWFLSGYLFCHILSSRMSYKRSYMYVAFWVWLLSSSMMLLRLICVAAYISMCWVVYHHMNIPRFHHTLTGCSIWIVSSLRQLWIELVFTFVYQFLWMYVSSFLLHKYLGGNGWVL